MLCLLVFLHLCSGLGTSAFQSFAQDAIDAGDFGVTEDDVTNALEFVMGAFTNVGSGSQGLDYCI